MSTPAVGPIVALTYAAAIDDPARFKSSKQAGSHFGLTPKKYQSGETDRSGRISKIGDASVREALYQAAHIMLTKPIKGCSQLKSWAMRIAKRAGMRKAKVALARKLAVILHRILEDGAPFNRPPRLTLQRLRSKNDRFSGGSRHQPSRSEVPSPGRWIRSGRHPGCRHIERCDHASVDWPTYPLTNPIRRRPLRRSRTEASPRRADDAKRD